MQKLKQLRKEPVNHEPNQGTLKRVLLEEIVWTENVRSIDDRASIKELAASIELHGQLQPIIIIPSHKEDNRQIYQGIAGQRRYEAFKYLLSLDKPTYTVIDAIVRDSIDSLETVQLIENVQRENLSPGDLENAVKAIIKREKITQAELARRLGKSRQWVTDILQAAKIRTEITENLECQAGLTNNKAIKTKDSKAPIIDQIPSSTLSEFATIKDEKQRAKAIKKTIEKGGTRAAARQEVFKIKQLPKEPHISNRDKKLESKILQQLQVYIFELSGQDRSDFITRLQKILDRFK